MIDHSLTYKSKKLKHYPHRLRLKTINRMISELDFTVERYCGVGCSNGWVTDVIRKKLEPKKVTGIDHCNEHLIRARSEYPNVEFLQWDLNIVQNSKIKYDLITCFETLEHVGNINNAIANLFELSKPGSTILISVPIEVGNIGLIKFLAKTLVFRYKLDELNSGNTFFYWRYLCKLIVRGDISEFRKDVSGYGTHFGFDYRLISKSLKDSKADYSLRNKGTTAFFIVKC